MTRTQQSVDQRQYFNIRVMGSTQDHHFLVGAHTLQFTGGWIKVVETNQPSRIFFAAPERCVYFVERIWK
jgi:hypothetical protein